MLGVSILGQLPEEGSIYLGTLNSPRVRAEGGRTVRVRVRTVWTRLGGWRALVGSSCRWGIVQVTNTARKEEEGTGPAAIDFQPTLLCGLGQERASSSPATYSVGYSAVMADEPSGGGLCSGVNLGSSVGRERIRYTPGQLQQQ